MSENKRFRKGKSILTDFPTGAIIDEETGERYYDGIKPSYISSKELVKILNEFYKENKELNKENEQLKKENKKLKYINKQVEDRLENSGIGIALDMGDFDD